MTEKIETKFGTATIDEKGYYRITSYNEGNRGKYVHRLIFEDFYKINLDEEYPKGIIIHHNDGNKTNNNIWNLVPISIGEHTSIHHKSKKVSEKTKKRISEGNKGKIIPNKVRIKLSKSQNNTGYFRVHKHKSNNCEQGFYWQYCYYDNGKRKAISSISLKKLKEKVIGKGLEWVIVDENKITEYC